MSDKYVRFRITVPTDKGFVGRKCPGADCGRYFKLHVNSLKDSVHCPYCGRISAKSDFTTRDQLAYVRRAGMEKAKEHVYREISKMFKNVARDFRSNKFVTFKHKSTPYRAKTIVPTYRERQVDSELTCPDCESIFQVYGIFAYCPGCGEQHILIYDANIAIIHREIDQATDKTRALRHAYSDLVSAFEAFCKKINERVGADPCNFQDLFEARRHFKKHTAWDMLSPFTDTELLPLRRVFQKRHAYTHEGGVITERYVKKIPEDSTLIGQKANVSAEEFDAAASLLHRVLDGLTRATGGE